MPSDGVLRFRFSLNFNQEVFSSSYQLGWQRQAYAQDPAACPLKPSHLKSRINIASQDHSAKCTCASLIRTYRHHLQFPDVLPLGSSQRFPTIPQNTCRSSWHAPPAKAAECAKALRMSERWHVCWLGGAADPPVDAHQPSVPATTFCRSEEEEEEDF